MAELNRRSFVAASAALAVGACASGALAGSAAAQEGEARSPQSQLNPQDYDYTANTKPLDAIFSPWKLGGIELSHRMVKSAAGSGYTKNPEAIVEYYRNFARGGVEMIWLENMACITKNFEVFDYGPLSEMPIQEIIDAIHAEGAHVGYQYDTMDLLIGKHQEIDFETFSQAVATDLSREDIDALTADIVDAVVELKGMGVEAFEINAAGNNLGQAFLSRMRNQRDDEYGPQTLENRARFVTNLIRAIKEACGPDFAVQVLINVLEENDTALGQNSLMTTLEENCAFARLFEAAGADSLHLRLGPLNMHVCQFASDLYFTGRGIDGMTGMGGQFDFKRHWQGKLDASHSGCGMTLDAARVVKECVSIPVGVVTYMDPAHAPDLFESAIEDGKCDFFLMNRPLTVDPAYVSKLREGRIDEIAPCTRCMHCHHDMDRAGNGYTHCRVNACTRRAYTEDMPNGVALEPAAQAKRVMVVGGGPAGMEAARIAALRGHDVALYEKADYLGGLLDYASAVKGPHENLLALKAYLARQLEVAGVEVHTGEEVDAAKVAEVAPDAVVLAMGGTRAELDLACGEGTKLVSMYEFLGCDMGGDVVIVGGGAQAVDAALYLMEKGVNVQFVLEGSEGELGCGQSTWVKAFVIPALYSLGARVWPNARIVSAGSGQATVLAEGGVEVSVPCTAVLDARTMLPTADALDVAGVAEVYAVGDCADPWNIENAITTGNLAGRRI